MKRKINSILLLFLLIKGYSQTNNYDIIYHRIYWEVNPEIKYIKGSVTSYFKITQENVDAIYFDMLDSLNVDSVVYKSKTIQYSHNNNLIKIPFGKILKKDDTDSVTIYYEGIPKSLNKGFGSFVIDKHDNIPILWTLSEPYGAREWWPCKQSLTDKIDSIDIYVKTPLNNKVASNGKLIYEKTNNNSKITYWKHRYPIATYLVAIAVTDYISYSQYANINNSDSVEILNYIYPKCAGCTDNVYLDSVKNQTLFTVKVIELFSKQFIPYPFYKEKYGHAQFGWHGGMEHQTMSFMGNFKEPLITHELAHQWFGNYITCGSWHHIWINEGFAVFCEYIAQEYIYPETYINWKKDRLKYILDKTKTGSVYVKDTTNIDIVFNKALTYEKGGFIIQMLRKQIGDTAFFNGTNNYLKNKQLIGGYAIAEDFKHCLEYSKDTNLSEYFNEWYYGEGYPNYTINWEQDCNKNLHITISQQTTSNNVSFFKLRIPILLKGINKEKIIELHNTKNKQEFVYNVDFVVNEIIFDPEYNILSTHPANIVSGVNNVRLQDKIKIIPNPVKNNAIIKTNKKYPFNKVIIIDTSGKILYEQSFNKYIQKTNINTSNLTAGLYYIYVYTNNNIITNKFTKNK